MKIRTMLGGLALAMAAGGSSLLLSTPAHAATPQTLCSEVIDVHESDLDVNTGCVLHDGDRVSVRATGTIGNGWWFSYNGPEGESGYADNRNYPLLSARKYSLLARTNNNYRYVGRTASFTYAGSGSDLLLRINDDVPGNGSGAFNVEVTVTH
jgi:hypothetical protein